MIVAKVPPADVPMKVLRLHVQREHVREQPSQVAGNLLNRVAAEISRRLFASFCHCLILLSISELIFLNSSSAFFATLEIPGLMTYRTVVEKPFGALQLFCNACASTAVSVNARRRWRYPSRTVQTWAKGTSMGTAVFRVVPSIRPSATTCSPAAMNSSAKKRTSKAP